MKRTAIVLLTTLIVMPLALPAQKNEKTQWRKIDDGYWQRKNLISVGLSGISFNGYGCTGVFP